MDFEGMSVISIREFCLSEPQRALDLWQSIKVGSELWRAHDYVWRRGHFLLLHWAEGRSLQLGTWKKTGQSRRGPVAVSRTPYSLWSRWCQPLGAKLFFPSTRKAFLSGPLAPHYPHNSFWYHSKNSFQNTLIVSPPPPLAKKFFQLPSLSFFQIKIEVLIVASK